MIVTPALSAYLDFLRFFAAFAVLLGHMDQDGVSMAWMPLSRYSHEAVVVFFVLSGFIIYYSTTSRASTWQQYAVARLSRIYSVALPAVLFSAGVALWLQQLPTFDPQDFSNYRHPDVWDGISSLLFLNESWLTGNAVTLNDPYWSLCYEVWYYVIFGAFFFARGRKRWLLAGVAALVAGPAILVLFPVWLMGAWMAAGSRHLVAWSCGIAVLAFTLPIIVILTIDVLGLDVSIQSMLYSVLPGYWRIDGSQRFVTDYLIGLALCLHIAAFSSLPAAVQTWFAQRQALWAALAGFSFTLYLFHRPMTQVIGAWWPQASGQILVPTVWASAILLVCWGISWGTEKQLPRWRRVFARLLERSA